MFRFVFGLAAFFATLSIAEAIVGGRVADQTVQQHTVMLTSRGQDCSGTLIARDLVITAAHCVAGDDQFAIRTSSGSIPVSRVVLHPAYRRDTYQTRRPSPDLAIVKLAQPAPRPLRPARLAQEKHFPPRGAAFLIAGFGEAVEGDRRVGTLRSTQLTNVGSTGGIMLRLAGSKNTSAGSCTGDSGGSAFRFEDGALVLHGVIAWAGGANGRTCGLVTGIVMTALQMDWIRSTAKRLGSPLE